MDKYFSRPKFWQRLLSFLICIVMLVFTVAAMLVADIRIATNKENTSAIIKEALFATHTVRLPGAGGNGHGAAAIRPQQKLAMIRLDEESGEVEEVDGALIEAIFNMVVEGSGGQINITLEEASAFIEESTFDEFAADLGASLISDLITGENTTVLDEETVTELLTENAPLLEEYFDLDMSEEVIKEVTTTVVESEYVTGIQEDGITNYLENNAELKEALGLPVHKPNNPENPDAPTSDGNENIGVPDTPVEETNPLADFFETARLITSTKALITCIAGVVVCIILLVLVNLKHVWFAIRGVGRTFVIASLPMAALTLVYMNNAAGWNEVFGIIPEIGPMIGKVVGMILKMTAPINLSVCGAGVALALLGTILKIVAKASAKRRAAAEAATAAVVEEPAPITVPQEVLEDTVPSVPEELPEEPQLPAEEETLEATE